MVLLILLSFLGMNSLHAGEYAEEEVDQNEGLTLQNIAVLQYKTLDDFMSAVGPTFMSVNNGVGMAIGVIQQGQAPKTYFFGESEKGSGKKPNGSTIFMIGSVSKTFTATLLALYVQRQLVTLADNLQTYVPAGVTVPTFMAQPQQITLETLATHTSGLPRNPPIPPGNTGGFSNDQLFQSLNQTTLLSAPGDKYLYSNDGFALLGQALAKVGNKTWGELIAQEISTPLGMVDTKVEAQLDGPELGRRAQGYRANGMPAPYRMPGFPSGNPAGGLYSTMDDMIKYLSFVMGMTNSPLNSLRPTLFQPRHPAGPNGKVALGWQMSSLSGTNYQVIYKPGSTAGFVAYIGFVPETGNGIVLLLNFLASKQMIALGQEILKYLVQQPVSINPNQKATPALENRGTVGPGPVERPQNPLRSQ